MNFFRGYVKTKNKKSLMPFKDVPTDQLLTYEQAKELPEYAGVLADNAILIDIDDFEASEKMMKIVEKEELICRIELFFTYGADDPYNLILIPEKKSNKDY